MIDESDNAKVLNRYAASVHLVITSEYLNPAEVTQVLNLQPSRAWKQGDSVKLRSGKEHFYPTGCWKLFQPNEIRQHCLEEQLDYWCALLESRKAALLGLVVKGMEIELNCFVRVEEVATIHLDHDLVSSIAQLGVDLSFAIHCEG